MPNRKYDYNRNYFEIINDEKKAYWLGFIFGDGCVRSNLSAVEFGIKNDDKNHLKKLVKCISGNKKALRETKNTTFLSICSKKMCNDLIDKKCFPRKSTKEITVPDIPKKLMRHFIRGLFDADGTIGFYEKTNRNHKYLSFVLAGCKTILEDILNFLKNKGIINSKNKIVKIKGSKQTYRIKYTYSKAEKIINFLHKGSNISLERKLNIWKNYLKYKKQRGEPKNA